MRSSYIQIWETSWHYSTPGVESFLGPCTEDQDTDSLVSWIVMSNWTQGSFPLHEKSSFTCLRTISAPWWWRSFLGPCVPSHPHSLPCPFIWKGREIESLPWVSSSTSTAQQFKSSCSFGQSHLLTLGCSTNLLLRFFLTNSFKCLTPYSTPSSSPILSVLFHVSHVSKNTNGPKTLILPGGAQILWQREGERWYTSHMRREEFCVLEASTREAVDQGKSFAIK